MVVSAPSVHSENEIYNGFLYKIKNETDQTIGYLFGTIHDFKKENELLLNKKIFKFLSNCKKLFLELNIFDEKTLITHLKNHIEPSEKQIVTSLSKEKNISYEQAIEEIAKLSVEELRKEPDTIESILSIKAEKAGIEIKSLETEESRNNAENIFKDEIKHLEIKRHFLVAHFSKCCIDEFNQFNENILNSNLYGALENLNKGYEFLAKAILNIDFEKDLKLLPKINELTDHCDKLFNRLGLSKDLVETLRILYFARENKDKFRLEKTKLAWKKGSEKMIEALKSDLTPVEAKAYELRLKIAFLRDELMVNQIDKELQQSSEKTRNFYAIGSIHLIENYENIIKRLEKKGWKIVSAYKDEVLYTETT